MLPSCLWTLCYEKKNYKNKNSTATDQWWIWRTEQTHLNTGLVQKLHTTVINEIFIFLKTHSWCLLNNFFLHNFSTNCNNLFWNYGHPQALYFSTYTLNHFHHSINIWWTQYCPTFFLLNFTFHLKIRQYGIIEVKCCFMSKNGLMV